MGSIGRHMFRTRMGALALTFVSQAIASWSTQATRAFLLSAGRRQALLDFIGIASLPISLPAMTAAPRVPATAHIVTQAGSSSEIIVNAAGVLPRPWATAS
jgi:hypothetical protein